MVLKKLKKGRVSFRKLKGLDFLCEAGWDLRHGQEIEGGLKWLRCLFSTNEGASSQQRMEGALTKN